tara:strand:- start:14 stop:277 length:264 start_codon:yes stop_codon:yes gene_type:complete
MKTKQITKIFNDSKFNNTDVAIYSLISAYTCEGEKFQFTGIEVSKKWKGISPTVFSRSCTRLVKEGFVKVESAYDYMTGEARILSVV